MHIRQIGILFFIVCFIGLEACKNASSNASAQEGTAVATFTKQFPKAQDVTWDSLDVGVVANFSNGKDICKAFYDAQGNFQHVTILMTFETLPSDIQSYIKKKYKTDIVPIAQLVNDGNNKMYQVEIETSTDYISLEFDGKGKFLKEIKHPLSNEELQQQEEEGVDETEK
jgi:hypothetical protein